MFLPQIYPKIQKYVMNILFSLPSSPPSFIFLFNFFFFYLLIVEKEKRCQSISRQDPGQPGVSWLQALPGPAWQLQAVFTDPPLHPFSSTSFSFSPWNNSKHTRKTTNATNLQYLFLWNNLINYIFDTNTKVKYNCLSHKIVTGISYMKYSVG